MSASGGTQDHNQRNAGSDAESALPAGPTPNTAHRGKHETGAHPPADAGTETRAPKWGKTIVGLLIALVMGAIMVTTYVWAEHGVVARNLPWGVTGSSPLTSAVQENVSMTIHTYASEADLVNAANQTTIYGGFVSQTNTVVISEAASLWAPGVMPPNTSRRARNWANRSTSV
ncbi:hypothetical protein [Amycolatopsis sp. NPDC051372]|uniref:hypothetical protein n=1 Tax=unclassified Amycolatopsis TaxID=2618356 RepID=UPI00341885F5